MKAAVWHGRKDLRVEEVSPPSFPAKGNVKVKVHWCGICGSDLHEYLAGPIFIPVDTPHPLSGSKAPMVLGHEFSGEIIEIGNEVEGLSVGDRVTANAVLNCGGCFWCKKGQLTLCEKFGGIGLHSNGAFAEYVNVSVDKIYKIPGNVSYESAALTEPLAVGMHAMRKGGIGPGDTVVIVGAGTIGLSTLQAAKAAGAKTVFVVEVAKVRKEYATKLGATRVLDPTEVNVPLSVLKDTDGIGADLSFECVGIAQTATLAFESIRRGGRMVVMGLFEKPSEIDFTQCMVFEKEIIGSLGYYNEFSTVLAFLSDGRLRAEPMITGKIKLENIVEEGFMQLIKNKDKNIKIIVTPLTS